MHNAIGKLLNLYHKIKDVKLGKLIVLYIYILFCTYIVHPLIYLIRLEDNVKQKFFYRHEYSFLASTPCG